MIIRCLIYVASFEFFLKSVHSSCTAAIHAQTGCRAGLREQLTRSAWYFYKRDRRETKTTLSHLTSAQQWKDKHRASRLCPHKYSLSWWWLPLNMQSPFLSERCSFLLNDTQTGIIWCVQIFHYMFVSQEYTAAMTPLHQWISDMSIDSQTSV